MKRVQFGGFVLGIKCGDERIAGCFHGTVGDSKEESARVETGVIPGEDRQQDPRKMPCKGESDDGCQSQGVAERSSDDHRQRETPEGCTIDPTQLFVGKMELRTP